MSEVRIGDVLVHTTSTTRAWVVYNFDEVGDYEVVSPDVDGRGLIWKRQVGPGKAYQILENVSVSGVITTQETVTEVRDVVRRVDIG